MSGHMFTHRKRLEVQGYCGYADQKLAGFAPGIRFAYQISTASVAVGLVLASIPILMTIMILAFFGVLLPRHPLDYLYNHSIRFWLKKPAMPRRSPQSKFAFLIGTLWLVMLVALFANGMILMGYIAGGILLIVGGLVSTVDICIPSMIYNFLFKIKTPTK